MQTQRISLAVDRHERAIDFTEMLWRGHDVAGTGFRMERHRIGPSGALRDFAVDDVLLGLCVAGSARMEYGGSREAERTIVRPGQITLLARGQQPRSISWSGVRETLYVSLPTARLEALGERALPAARAAVSGQYGVPDPELARLVTNLYIEERNGSPSGRLYAQSLATAIASYVLARYAAPGQQALKAGGGLLSAAKAARLCEYIGTHLECDIALGELAALVGLSPHYFASVFKNTFRTTPHTYLLRKRVCAAKKLLAARDMPISDVAQSLGFADQSHFTRVFRKLTGTTPSRFQRASA